MSPSERALAAMPPEPPEITALPEPERAAFRAIRAEYGALAIRNSRRIQRMLRVLVIGLVVLVTIQVANGVISASTLSRSQDATHDVATLAHRLADDEHQTCKIQARGLPANHHLAKAMGDIAYLLGLTPQRPSEPADVVAHLTDLATQSAAYAAIQATQPQTRTC